MVGQYEVLSKLGEGGMGTVYRARDIRLGRDVALKVLSPEAAGDEERRMRFTREARAASRLNHPNIVTIYDIAEETLEDGSRIQVIAMEHVAGKTLSALIYQGLDLAGALALAQQIAGALAKAHAAGIVHRDLKPANIMVTEDGDAKVLDFGIAKLAENTNVDLAASTATSAGTRLGMVLGTASYMSPEQASGHHVDARSDIFSFGLVLYEMLSGQRAFPAESSLAAIAAILYSEPRPLTGVPAAVESIVTRCLRKAPADRYQTMDEVKAALHAAAVPVSAGAAVTGPATTGARTPSIAVLPFLNMNRDEENEFFCDGLTEELINGLSQLRNLRVVSRSTVFQFKGRTEDIRQIGEKLQVSNALEGSVRRAGNRIRITAQLVNLSDGMQMWSQRFDRELKTFSTCRTR